MAGPGVDSCKELAKRGDVEDVVQNVQNSLSILEGNLSSTSIAGERNQLFQGCTFNVTVQQTGAASLSAGTVKNDIKDKLEHLVNGLKSQYRHRYLFIRPASYHSDMWKGIHEVFIENTVEDEGRVRVFKSLDEKACSRHMVIKQCLEGKRLVIHSDPGYGKSTLLQQYAHDWCTLASDTPLQNVSIFILLRMRDLGSTNSIYDAIRSLLPAESILTTDEIKELLTCGKFNALFAFDGLDEYPYAETKNSDITKIIIGQMFGSFGVIVTARQRRLKELERTPVTRFRLTGFNRIMQNMYLAKIMPANEEKRTAILSELDGNDILSVLCESPLFFAFFAHAMGDDIVDCNFDSVTSYFSYMVACSFSHFRQKVRNDIPTATGIITEKKEHWLALAKLAYDGLSCKPPSLVWTEESITQELGLTCYELYTKVGLLLKEEERIFEHRRDFHSIDHLRVHTRVSFVHTTVQEYYAALYIAYVLKTNSTETPTNILNTIDPNNFHYVFQFVCGLGSNAASHVTSFLSGFGQDGQMLATLCLFEQGQDGSDDVIAELCKNQIVFFHEDSKLLQRCKVQLLQMASRREIPIFSVCLFHCFDGPSEDGQSLLLSSGFSLPRLKSLKMLMIDEIDDLREHTERILEYAAKCSALRSLIFELVLLPMVIENESVLVRLKRQNCEVQWFYKGNFWHLDMSSGRWKNDDGDVMNWRQWKIKRYFIEAHANRRRSRFLQEESRMIKRPIDSRTFAEPQPLS